MREDDVYAAMREVIDPEIGVNVVDLGLVYHVETAPDAVRIEMTMTSPGCPLGEYLRDEAEAALRRAWPALRAVDITFVWDPPWGPERMSEAARRQLGEG